MVEKEEVFPRVLVCWKLDKMLKPRDGKPKSPGERQILIAKILSGAITEGETVYKWQSRHDERERAINITLHSKKDKGWSKPMFEAGNTLLYRVPHSIKVCDKTHARLIMPNFLFEILDGIKAGRKERS